jgi:hypothetical protein
MSPHVEIQRIQKQVGVVVTKGLFLERIYLLKKILFRTPHATRSDLLMYHEPRGFCNSTRNHLRTHVHMNYKYCFAV